MIIDAIVYFKYYLNHDNFTRMIDTFMELLSELQGKIKGQAFDKVRASLGIHDMSHLARLLAQPKYNQYHKHS